MHEAAWPEQAHEEPLRPPNLPPLDLRREGGRVARLRAQVRSNGEHAEGGLPGEVPEVHHPVPAPLAPAPAWVAPAPPKEAALDALDGTIKFETFMYEVEEEEPDHHHAARSSLSCTRGPGGVSSLSLSLSVADGDLGATMGFGQTMSAAGTVHGAVRKWARGDVIGRGSMGTVFQAMDQQSGQVFAVKEVLFNSADASDCKFREQLEREIDICQDLKHSRIVSYLGHETIEGNLYIYLEYMPGGSMASVLKQFGAFEEPLIAVYTRELLEGLDYLHSREPAVAHRDVKSANILVGLDTRVKLSDFGCSKRMHDSLSHTIKGSIPWMAPEVITGTGHGRLADIWSFGCVMIEMATAQSPWGKFDNPMAAMRKIGMSNETPPIPEFLSPPCQDFIRACVCREKEHRPPASKLLMHDFVRDLLTED